MFVMEDWWAVYTMYVYQYVYHDGDYTKHTCLPMKTRRRCEEGCVWTVGLWVLFKV